MRGSFNREFVSSLCTQIHGIFEVLVFASKYITDMFFNATKFLAILPNFFFVLQIEIDVIRFLVVLFEVKEHTFDTLTISRTCTV